MIFKIPDTIIKAFLINNFDVVKETSGGEFRINSPFAQDNKFHMYVNPEKGVVHDFKTDYGHDFITFVSDYLQISKREVIPFLLKNYSVGKNLDNFSISNYIEKTEELVIPDGLHFFAELKKGIIRNQAYKYLKGRKISEEVINELGYIYNPNSEYNKMIFVPFYEEGKLVYFLARDFTNNNFLRYNNPHGLNSKQFVYNIDKIEDTVFIFEGVFDALMLKEQVGTAMLSADLGKQQAIKILNKVPDNIIFVPDNDETGKKTLEKNIKLILRYKAPSQKLNILIYYLQDVKDFGETGNNSIDINNCIEWKEKTIENIMKKIYE